METMEAIGRRRSIRLFRNDPLPRGLVNRVLEAACMAPSAKNAQPWRFLVFDGRSRLELVSAVRKGLLASQGARSSRSDLEHTLRAMEQAPVLLLVFMARVDPPPQVDFHGSNQVADIQSIGACIQNLLLAAVDQGLGTLWICDILDAVDSVERLVRRPEQLVAAVALGYPAEDPPPRPRRPLVESVVWVESTGD